MNPMTVDYIKGEVFYQYIIIGKKTKKKRWWKLFSKPETDNFEVLHRFDFVGKEDDREITITGFRTKKVYWETKIKYKEEYKLITMFRIEPEFDDFHYYYIKGCI